MGVVSQRNDQIKLLFERYGPMVYRKALRMLRNESRAEEATQEIFIRVINGIEQFDGRSKLSTWLFQVATNHCLNEIRNAKRRRELWDDQVIPMESFRADEARDTTKKEVHALIAEADPELAMVAACVYVHGMTGAEAAEKLGVSRRTINNRLERFKVWARANFDPNADQPEPVDTS